MLLLYAVLCLSLAAAIYAAALLGSRNPKAPKWAADALVANIYIPLIVGLLLLGLCLVVSVLLNLGKSAPGATELTISAVAALVTFFGIKQLRIGDRIRRWEAETPAAPVIPIDRRTPEPGAPRPKDAGRTAA